MGYTGFEAVVVCDQAMREGGPSWCQTPKPRCRGSVLANEMWGVLFSGRGNHIGVGYTGFDVVVVGDQVMCEGEPSWGQIQKRGAGARFWPKKRGEVVLGQRGPYLGGVR